MTQYVSYINANGSAPLIEGRARPLPDRGRQRRKAWRSRLDYFISLFDLFSRQSGPGGYADYTRKI